MTSKELKHEAKRQEFGMAIQECRSSGLSVSEWCRQRGVATTTYEQETGEANIVKVAKKPALLPSSFASAEAVAYLATQKFVMYSPLYRLEQDFGR